MSGLYRGIDIELETLNALAWLKNNPTRRKTYTGMKSYLGRWYSRAQNNAGSRASPQARAPAQKPDPYAELRARVEAKAQEVAND